MKTWAGCELGIAWIELKAHGPEPGWFGLVGEQARPMDQLRPSQGVFGMPDLGNVGNLGSSAAAGYAAGVRSVGDANARRTNGTAQPPVARSGDRVEVSEVARWLEEMNRLPAIREDKVAAAKAAIADGDYDSDDKLAIAVNRMIDEASSM